MKYLLTYACAGFLSLVAMSLPQVSVWSAAQAGEMEKAEGIKAVLIFADWCSSCKILDPKVEAVKATGPIDGVEHVKLDYTTQDTEAFFAAADEAGIGEAVRARFADKVKTGLLLVIDAGTGTIVQELTKANSEDEIKAALMSATSS